VVTYGRDAADVAFATQFGTAKLTDFRVGEQVRGFYIDAFEEATQRVSGFLEGFSRLTRSTCQQQLFRVFNQLLEQDKELHSLLSIDNAVIIAECYIHH
jgi:hypothetical protein